MPLGTRGPLEIKKKNISTNMDRELNLEPGQNNGSHEE